MVRNVAWPADWMCNARPPWSGPLKVLYVLGLLLAFAWCTIAQWRATDCGRTPDRISRLVGQNGGRGLPGGQAELGPAGRSAIDRVLKGL